MPGDRPVYALFHSYNNIAITVGFVAVVITLPSYIKVDEQKLLLNILYHHSTLQ